MTKQEIHEQYLYDPTAYCCYCGTVQISFSCCGENHFETYAQMDHERQEEFLSYEDYEE